MVTSSTIQSNPLRIWLGNITKQEKAFELRTKRLQKEIIAMHASLAQITQSPELKPELKNTYNLVDLPEDLNSKVKSHAEQLSKFISDFIQQSYTNANKEFRISLMKRANELLKLIFEFNISKYESLNDFLVEEFPELHESQDILGLQPFIIKAAVEKLPDSITKLNAGTKSKLINFAEEMHILLFGSRLDPSTISSVFSKSFSKSYNFWINQLEKFFESDGKVIPESLKTELGPSFGEWNGFLIVATLMNALKLNKNDPEKYPLKLSLEKKFNLLSNLQILVGDGEADNSIIQSVIDDFNSEEFDSEAFEPEIEISEYVNRLYPGLEETFNVFRLHLIQTEISKLCSSLVRKPNSDTLELTNDWESSSSNLSEEELLKEVLPRIYTLITKQRMRSEDAARNVDEFFQVKPSKDRLLENRLEAFLKCDKVFLNDLTLLIMKDLPQLITKLTYESIIHEGLEIKGFEMDRLVEFINRLDNLKYDLQPSMPQA